MNTQDERGWEEFEKIWRRFIGAGGLSNYHWKSDLFRDAWKEDLKSFIQKVHDEAYREGMEVGGNEIIANYLVSEVHERAGQRTDGTPLYWAKVYKYSEIPTQEGNISSKDKEI